MANITPLLLDRVGAAYHTRPVTTKALFESTEAMRTLSNLCQDFGYCCEVFKASNPSLLSIVDKARQPRNSRSITYTTSTTTHIGEVAQSIQFAGIGCVKIRTNPRPDDPHGLPRLADSGWKIEMTWNWLLQTMLALKLLPTDNSHISKIHYELGLSTLHHLLTRKSGLTNQQSKNAWLLLGREEIPDLYANLICAQLHDTDRMP